MDNASINTNIIEEDEQTAADIEIEVRSAVVGPHQHKNRLDKVIVEVVPELSRSYLQKLILDGALKLEGAVVVKTATRVQVGQKIEIELRPSPDVLAFSPEEMALDIIYEDEHLLVLNKPAGLVVHPGAGNWSGTLLNGLLAHDAQAKHLPRAGIVHRLDKDTSGLLLVGRTLQMCHMLVALFARRELRRTYVALVHGCWSQAHREKTLVIDEPIGRDMRSRVKMAVRPDGKVAKTSVEFLAGTKQYSLLRCQLHTGRTHQIRVHLAHLGYPIVADQLYGGVLSCNMERQALHAYQLSVKHPLTEKLCVFEQKWPDDLLQAVKIAELGYNPTQA